MTRRDKNIAFAAERLIDFRPAESSFVAMIVGVDTFGDSCQPLIISIGLKWMHAQMRLLASRVISNRGFLQIPRFLL
jgi:hypothetical protein